MEELMEYVEENQEYDGKLCIVLLSCNLFMVIFEEPEDKKKDFRL